MVNKKPKFKLDLNINELSNIPQVSGNCYLEVSIRDKKRVNSLSLFRRGHSVRSGDSDSDKSTADTPEISDSGTSVGNGTGGNITMTTSHKKIHNFKCSFNYKIGCNVKFGLKRRENLIADKYLLIRVFYVGEKHKEFGVHHTQNKLELGKLEINLSEYLNFNEPITSKYLLKDSKVNSILSVTIHLAELPANFDFHTQLQVSDNGKSAQSSMTARDRSTGTDSTKGLSGSGTQYNVPQFERRNVFGGLNDVIGGGENKRNSSDSYTRDTSSKESRPGSRDRHDKYGHDNQKKKDRQQKDKDETKRYEQGVLIDPIVNGLYKKILESTWDPKLHTLLEFNPEFCINSIFDNNYQEWRQRLKEGLSDEQDEEDEIRCIHGLINETSYREDLKSWNIKGH